MSVRYLIRTLSLIALCSSPCISQAQQPFSPPRPIDLHAAYCIAYLKWEIDFVNTAMVSYRQPSSNSGGAPEPPALKALREKALASATVALNALTASLKKIQLYLLPRIMYLNPLGLAAAVTAEKDDVMRFKQTSDECANECAYDLNCDKTCDRNKMPDLPYLQKKWETCSEPDWLPF